MATLEGVSSYRFMTKVLYYADKNRGLLNQNQKYPNGHALNNEGVRLALESFTTDDQKSPNRDKCLPPELVAKVLSDALSTNRSWMEQTGILGHKQSRSIRQDVVDMAAATQLKRLNIQRNFATTSTQQLWSQIFTDAFSVEENSLAVKREIIAFAAQVDSAAMEQTAWRATAYHVTNWGVWFFTNMFTRCAIAVIAFFVMRSISKTALKFCSDKGVPLLAHKAMVYLPPHIIKKANQAYGLGSRVAAYHKRQFLKVWIVVFFVDYFFSSRFPAAGWPYKGFLFVNNYVRGITYLPWRIAVRAAGVSFNAHRQISESANRELIARQDGNLALGGQLAYDVWMRLMDRALTEGITLPAQASA